MSRFIFSERTSGWSHDENPLTQKLKALRSRNLKIADLTLSNPTLAGFSTINRALLSPLNRSENLIYHPDPHGLDTALAAVQMYYQEKGISLARDQIFLAANSSEAYSFVFKLLLNPGSSILTSAPSYPLLNDLVHLHDGSIHRYHLMPDSWDTDWKSTAQCHPPDLKAVLLVNPHNPTGHYQTPVEFEDWLQYCQKQEIALISDEVFFDYAHDEKNPGRSLASQNEVLTFTISGISKVLGLPQMKLSWIVVTGPPHLRSDAISKLEIISDTYLSASTPAQNALADWLTQRPAIQGEIRTRCLNNLMYFQQTWQQASLPRPNLPQGGWSLCVPLPPSRNCEEWALTLLDQDQVLVHPGYFYDFPDSEAFMVISLITPENTFKEGLTKIARRIAQRSD